MAFTKRKRNPRSKAVILEVVTSAMNLYAETGGRELDRALDAAENTHAMAMKQARQYISPEDQRKQNPVGQVIKALHEWRMLEAQKERKLAQCRRDVEEMCEHDEIEAEAAAKAAEESPEGTPPPEPASAPHQGPRIVRDKKEAESSTTPEQNKDQASR